MSGDEFVDGDLLNHRTDEQPQDPAPGDVELDRETQEIDERLRNLRREQDEIEQRRGELEELRRRQELYVRQRGQVNDDLAGGLVTLERGIASATDRLEWMHETRSRFRDLLTQVEAIDDRAWTPQTLHEELHSALRLLDDARIEHARVQEKLNDMNAPRAAPELEQLRPDSAGAPQDFVGMLKLGFAVALPTAIVLGAALLILAMMLQKG